MGGYFNIIVGIIIVVAGLSGRFTLLGVADPKLLAAIGLIPIAMGIFQLYSQYKRRRGL